VQNERQDILGELHALLMQQQAEIKALRAEMSTLKSIEAAPLATLPTPKQVNSTSATGNPRRLFLKKLASVGAGLAAMSVVAGLDTTTIQAATGKPLLIDTTNTGFATTSLQGSKQTLVFRVDNARPLQGTMQIPLPANTSVTFSASATGNDATTTNPTPKVAIFGYSDGLGPESGANNVAILGQADTSATGVSGTSVQGIGVKGVSTGGTAVVGYSTTGNGILGSVAYGTGTSGTSVFGIGVTGSSERGTAGVSGSVSQGTGSGVQGSSTNGSGVSGFSLNNVGVTGSSTNGLGGSFSSGSTAQLALDPGATVGSPTTGQHGAGWFYVDAHGALFYCIQTGNPGVWVKLAGV
jgi:hypothetical protein